MYLVDKGVGVNAKDNHGHTPLYIAVRYSDLHMVKYLIKKGANVNTKDNEGDTPLHIAARFAHNLEMIKYLIENGADVRAKCNDGYTPLHYAVRSSDNLDTIKCLVRRGAEINAKDNSGRTPLYSAIHLLGTLDVIKYLIDKGADINVRDNYGYTPLHNAASASNLEGVKYLIEEGANANANINAKGNNGYTPLHFAARSANLNMVEYLVEKGADIHAKNNRDKTPLELAQEECPDCKSVIDFLKGKGIDRIRRDVEYSLNDPTNIANASDHLLTALPISHAKETLLLAHTANNTTILQFDLHNMTSLFNSIMLLLNVFVRKVFIGKFIKQKSVPITVIGFPQELSDTLNASGGFEEAVKHAEKESGIAVDLSNIDFREMHKEIAVKIARGKPSEVLEVLISYAEEACANGQMNAKECKEFMKAFNAQLNIDSNQTLPNSHLEDISRSNLTIFNKFSKFIGL